MRFVAKICTSAFFVGLVLAVTTVFSGCDSPTSSTDYKPIESNILKKLGQANQAQSDAANAQKPARAQKKK